MLLQLKLKNFRQHEDKTFDFTEGLQVIRGANEKGKTTILEGIGYGLFGADACRDPLAQVVTWGKNEKELYVEQLWRLNGVTYSLHRSKSGAEVITESIGAPRTRIVGQSTVTKFMQNLFGCDAKVGANLMMASQGEIRGALAAGPTKTAELIETLADFDQIDRLIETLQATCVTGPANLAEDRVKQAQAALDAAKAAAVPVDVSALEAHVAVLTANISARQHEIDTKAKPLYEQAKAAMHEAEHAANRRGMLHAQLVRAGAAKGAHQVELETATKIGAGGPTTTAVEMARERVKAAENIEAELAMYRQFAALRFPEQFWEGDEASFQKELLRLAAGRDEHRRTIQKLETDIRDASHAIDKLETQRVIGSACGFCAKDVSNVPEVVAKNGAIDAQIAMKRGSIRALTALRDSAIKTSVEAAEEALGMDAVHKAAQPFMNFLARHGDRVVFDDDKKGVTSYPPRLSWRGLAPKANVDVAAVRKQLAQVEALQKAAERAQAQAEQIEKTLNEDVATISRLTAEIEALVIADALAGRQEALDRAAELYNDAMVAVINWKGEKEKLARDIAAAKEAYERAMHEVAKAEAAKERAERELEQLHFNNALLKRIRTARPIIADKLWSMVLSAVSTYFSRMRNTPSVVAREGKSFVVDGKRSALSGSTLDILGLAIRVALTRTFLPNAPVLILDEPAAAMDDDRTAATMAFLVSSGFPQTLLVTHEEMSESVANNLITI